jgi:ribosomal protein L11 methyltransferase
MSPSADEPRYPHVVVELSESDAEEAGARLFELGALGVEQRDATTLTRGVGDLVTLVAAFSHEDEARRATADLPGEWRPRLEHVVGDAWRDEWKKHFEPFVLCRGVVVRPPWRTYSARADERVITLEPGRAFGTGLHETTRLVAEALVDRVPPSRGSRVLDVGCGSGILALTSIVLGAKEVRAVDIDPEAIAVTRENAERNGVSDRVVVDETPVDRIAQRFPIVLANIEATTLIDLAAPLIARLADAGTLVLSGILAPDVIPGQWDGVRRAYPGLAVEAVLRKGEWIAAVLRA